MPNTTDDVVFNWSDNGLSLTMSNTGKHGKSQKVKLEWENHSEIPSKERLAQIYNNYFDNTESYSSSTTEIYGKTIDLPFNKQLTVGAIKEADFDDALFRLGKFDISFPITKDNKLVFKAPKITKSKNFGFGAGSSSNAAWFDLKNKD